MAGDLDLSKSEQDCGTCGSRLLPRANYCHFCGKKLASGPGYSTPKPPPNAKKKKPKVKKTAPGMAGAGSPVMGCLSALLGILLLVVLGVVAGGYWQMKKKHRVQMQDREAQMLAEVELAEGKIVEGENLIAEAGKKVEAAELAKAEVDERLAEVEAQRDKLGDRIDGLQRRLKIESRLRQGKESFVDRGRFEHPDEDGEDVDLQPDPLGGSISNRVLKMGAGDVFSEEAWIPDDIEAVRVRFRVFLQPTGDGEDEVVVTEEDGEEVVDGEAEEAGPGKIKVQMVDVRSESVGKSIELLPSQEWMEVELVFTNIGEKRRRVTVEAEGFDGDVFIDDFAVVPACPVVLEPAIFKFYSTPVEKVYYYFSQQLQSAYNENVELELPRVTRGTVSLRFALNGEDLSYRFGTRAKGTDNAQITVGPVGEKSEIYLVEREPGSEVWNIVGIEENPD
ncbi:MAG: hypothetical protein AAF591_00430 [Verrucomicrobiota bacterium]